MSSAYKKNMSTHWLYIESSWLRTKKSEMKRGLTAFPSKNKVSLWDFMMVQVVRDLLAPMGDMDKA